MNIDLSKNIYDMMVSHQFVMSVVGNLNQEVLKSLIKATEKKLNSLETDDHVKKRIFHFMIECAQNLCRETQHNKNRLFLIGKIDRQYIVYLASVFKSEQAEKIVEIIERINLMDSVKVKEHFYSEMMNKTAHDQLLLSLLDISKRSKEKISYEVNQIDPFNRFLSFKTLINI